jgi:hypothetical protein
VGVSWFFVLTSVEVKEEGDVMNEVNFDGIVFYQK